LEDTSAELTKFTNIFIKKITNNLENFHYNVIVANLHEMYSFLIKEIKKGYQKKTIIENYKKILITMMPVLPHFTNECIESINEQDEIIWPNYEESLIKDNSNIIVIQINGKKRGLIETKPNINEDNLMNLINKDKNIVKYFVNKEIKRKIYIKNKLLNIII
jgi:leucyl-tRNA synthetase